MQELKDAINTNKDSAPGPDGIHNRMLKNIPENLLIQLLNIYLIDYMTPDSYLRNGNKLQ